MTDKKFTDEEIIKALECCKMPVGSGACNNCPFDYQRKKRLTGSDKSCTTLMFDYALALINRLKAEIERLQKENHCFADIGKMYSEVKAEAIREFAERLKKYSECYSYVTPRDIDNLVKEMVGEDNG